MQRISFKQTFQVISYLQYPLMVIAIFYTLKPYMNGFDYLRAHPNFLFENYNKALIFMGLGISFSTLQDTTKMQNNVSKKVWENPKKGTTTILVLSIVVLLVLSFGIFGYFVSTNSKIEELSFGAIVLGVGLIGFLKTALEAFENHRLDKKTEIR